MKIEVEGNIGSGKSTLLNYLEVHNFDGLIAPEPINKWRDCNGTNIFKNFLLDPVKWGFGFQMMVMMTLLERETKLKNEMNKIIFFERSINSSQNVFVNLLKNGGLLNQDEINMLKAFYDTITENNLVDHPDLIVYLKTTPSIALERVKKRNRGEENVVTREHLEAVNFLYEEYIANTTTPVITIDADKPLDEVYLEYEKILNFINITKILKKE